MHAKLFECLIIFFSLLQLSTLNAQTFVNLVQDNTIATNEAMDLYIHSLASLTYHLQEMEESLQSKLENALPQEDGIFFSDQDIRALWERVANILYSQKATTLQNQNEYAFQKAYDTYHRAKELLLIEDWPNAHQLTKRSFTTLSHLWEEAIEQECFLQKIKSFPQLFQKAIIRKKTTNQDFTKNPVIPNKIKEKMAPHIIPDTHPLKKPLDSIFLQTRATVNERVFKKSGFKTISHRPRSHIYVAKHPLLPHYLVKVYMDTEQREKLHHPSWEWLVRRCEGADKIRYIIDKRHLRYFTVASKWIYPLPANPAPPLDSNHTRHLAILLVSDMNLASKKKNYHAWYHYITKDHLDELYCIISRAKGSSYRPDNIAYTNQGLFAFIDTEYPSKGPDYKSIRSHLNPDMQEYWDYLVRNGGDSF